MTPIAITFHFPPSSSSSSSTSLNKSKSKSSQTRVIATNSRLPHAAYITYDVPSSKPTSKPKPQSKVGGRPEMDAASSTSTSTSASGSGSGSGSTSEIHPHPSSSRTTNSIGASKRRKGPVMVYPSEGVKTASLTPLLRPIVTRCSIHATAASSQSTHGHGHAHDDSTANSTSPPRRRNGHRITHRVTSSLNPNSYPHVNTSANAKSITNPRIVHPYSRATDLSNTRSSVPSPREVMKARKAEEEKERLKKEGAAAARAALMAKKRKPTGERGKTRSASRAPNGPASGAEAGLLRRRSDSAGSTLGGSKPPSPEGERERERERERTKDGIPTITTEQPSIESSRSPSLPSTSTFAAPSTSTFPSAPKMAGAGTGMGMKRTRSQGVLPILTNGVGVHHSSNIVGIGSPLKAVMSRDADETDGEGDGEGPRKRSKLATATTPNHGVTSADLQRSRSAPGARSGGGKRANTHSPVGSASALPDDAGHEQLSKTVPLQPGKVLPSRLAAMAGSPTISAENEIGGVGTRAGSVGSGASDGGRERSKREINLPERLRDYEFKSAPGLSSQ